MADMYIMFLLWLPLLVNVTNRLLSVRAQWEGIPWARDTRTCVLVGTPTLSDIVLYCQAIQESGLQTEAAYQFQMLRLSLGMS